MLRRFGRPGLLGLAARTAVVAGTAGAINNRAMNRREEQEQERQQQEYIAQQQAQQQYAAQQQQQQYAAQPQQPAASGSSDLINELSRLGDLHAKGMLTDQEFAAAKAKLLA